MYSVRTRHGKTCVPGRLEYDRIRQEGRTVLLLIHALRSSYQYLARFADLGAVISRPDETTVGRNDPDPRHTGDSLFRFLGNEIFPRIWSSTVHDSTQGEFPHFNGEQGGTHGYWVL